MRYTARSLARFASTFRLLTPFGVGTEDPRVGGSIPSPDTTFAERNATSRAFGVSGFSCSRPSGAGGAERMGVHRPWTGSAARLRGPLARDVRRRTAGVERDVEACRSRAARRQAFDHRSYIGAQDAVLRHVDRHHDSSAVRCSAAAIGRTRVRCALRSAAGQGRGSGGRCRFRVCPSDSTGFNRGRARALLECAAPPGDHSVRHHRRVLAPPGAERAPVRRVPGKMPASRRVHEPWRCLPSTSPCSGIRAGCLVEAWLPRVEPGGGCGSRDLTIRPRFISAALSCIVGLPPWALPLEAHWVFER